PGGGDDAVSFARNGRSGDRRRGRGPGRQGRLRFGPDADPGATVPVGSRRVSRPKRPLHLAKPAGRERTERDEVVAQARRVSQMYAALSAANEASAQLKDERNLYQRICDIMVQFGGMRLASVRLPRPGTHWLETCAYAGPAASYLGDARISTDPSLPEGRGLGGPAM